MNNLKTYFPFAFQPKADVIALVINIIVHLIIGAVVGVVVGLLNSLPLVNVVIGLAGAVIGLYLTVSTVLSILHFLKIVK